MKIIYLSDFNCPYSYIGLNRIMEVCNELSLDVNWEMKSFELEPKLTEVADACDRYAIRNNTTPDNAKSEIEEIEEIAKSEGLNMNYMDLKLANSKDAHRLVKYCERRHPQTTQEIILKIFESNFIDNENISDKNILVKIATSCGLDEKEISQFLESETLFIEVDLDMDEALSNGINTTPYYIITYKDERLMVPGVFDKESFRIAFEDIISGNIKNNLLPL